MLYEFCVLVQSKVKVRYRRRQGVAEAVSHALGSHSR